MVEFDNRHFWMKLKRLVASHFANYAEAWAANRLIDQGRIDPLLSAVYPLDEVGLAARSIHRNEHEGKLGVLCLARARASASTTPTSAPASARTASPPIREAPDRTVPLAPIGCGSAGSGRCVAGADPGVGGEDDAQHLVGVDGLEHEVAVGVLCEAVHVWREAG